MKILLYAGKPLELWRLIKGIISPIVTLPKIRQSAGKENMNFQNQLCWLAGIIEGEGTVGMYKAVRKEGNPKISPILSITNTDPWIINQCDKIIRKLGVIPYVVEKSPDVKQWNTCYILKIQNHKDITIVLEAIMNSLYSHKKAISQLMLRFLHSRLRENDGKRMKGLGTGYTQQEKKVYSLIREMNGRGKDKKFPPPETIREKLKSCDIVRTSAKSEEASRNDLLPHIAE